MNLQYLIKYKSFISIKEMDDMVKQHVSQHYDKLTASDREVIYCLARHSLSAIGASHLKTATIASELGISERTVMRSTKKLTEIGIIIKYKTVKRTGQGASIFVIAPKIKMSDVSHPMSISCQSLETHVSLTVPTDSHEISNTVTKNLSTSSFNPCVIKNVNTYDAYDNSVDLKSKLKEIYGLDDSSQESKFEELSKIAFGRIKQFMKSHSVPFTQLEQIVIKAMRDLKNKSNVRNEFAMYSKMIERQVLQLFEAHVKPVMNLVKESKELIPDWFNTRKEALNEVSEEVDFEAERLKVLQQLGGI